MARLDEALEKIGQGISLNSFCFEFEHEAVTILDKLVRSKKVHLSFSKKHKITVIMPIENRTQRY